MRFHNDERVAAMIAKELIDILDNSERLQVIEDGKVLFCGWVALLTHEEKEDYIRSAKVKRFSTNFEIRHKNWKEKGLMAPLQPDETPNHYFRDLQLTLYNTIYI